MTDRLTTDTEVLVVGAGPTGLTLAVDLRRRGVDVRLVDRSPAAHHRSRGKGVQPRTLEVLDDLGLVEAALAAGRSGHHLRLYAGGALAADLAAPARPPRPGVPHPNLLVLPQWRTEQLLRDRLAELGGAVQTGRELRGFTQDADGVTAVLADVATGATERVRAAYLVGSDGARSAVRDGAGLVLRRTGKAEHFVLGDVRLDGLPADGSSFAWFDGDRYLAADPLDGRGVWQVQASVRPGADGVLPRASLELFGRLFAERGFPHVRLYDATWLSDFAPAVGMVDRYRVGRVLLAGDAAHVHSPAGGQGMNTGVQDAYNLGWKLALALRGAPDRLLDSYGAERAPVARAVLHGSDLGHSAVFSPHPAVRVLRERVLIPLLQLPPVRRAVLARTEELDVGYRGSPVVTEAGPGGWWPRRGPRAGDRAPDARVRDAAGRPLRLFDRFRGPHATLLLLGEAPGLVRAAREVAGDAVRPTVVLPPGPVPDRDDVVVDTDGELRRLYRAAAGTVLLVRPDGHVGYRSATPAEQPLRAHLRALYPTPIAVPAA